MYISIKVINTVEHLAAKETDFLFRVWKNWS